MPCVLEKAIMRELSKHVESCSSATRNISPIQQCLLPPNLAGRTLIMRAHTTIPMATKCGSAVTYCEGVTPIKSNYHLIKLSCGIM